MGLLYKKSRTNKQGDKTKWKINKSSMYYLQKYKNLIQEILQHEINNAAKDLELSGAKERIAELETPEEEANKLITRRVGR